MQKIHHFKDFSIRFANIRLDVNMKGLENKFNAAQLWLDNQIMQDMKPYMPQLTETLQNLTSAESAAMLGTGQVAAAAGPYGRFQYMGKVMVDPVTNSPWARKKAKKVVTGRSLTYSRPGAQAQWFEAAMAQHKQQWVDGVAKIIGGQHG